MMDNVNFYMNYINILFTVGQRDGCEFDLHLRDTYEIIFFCCSQSVQFCQLTCYVSKNLVENWIRSILFIPIRGNMYIF